MSEEENTDDLQRLAWQRARLADRLRSERSTANTGA